MKLAEYNEILFATGLRQAVLCQILGVHQTSASRWRRAGEIPRWVVAFLRAWEMLEAPARTSLLKSMGRK